MWPDSDYSPSELLKLMSMANVDPNKARRKPIDFARSSDYRHRKHSANYKRK